MTAPRPELARLLAACKQEPEDDAVRLVLSDWLEENGDAERAAFVRMQVAAGPGDGRPDFSALRARTWERHLGEWVPFHIDLDRSARPTDERGVISASAAKKGVNAPQARRWGGTEAWAWVGRLRLRPPTGQVGRIIDSPLLDTLGVLDIHQSRIDDEDMKHLARSFRPSWRGLWLREMHVGPAGLSPLFESPNAAGLRSLRLGESAVSARDAEAFGAAGAFPSLEELELPGASAAWARSLTAAAWRLSSLSIVRGESASLPRAAAEADCCAALRRLTLAQAALDFGSLAAGRFWPTLEELALENCFLNPEDAGRLALAAAPSLRRLSLFGTPLLPEIVRTLAGSALMASLTYLRLRDPRLGPAGVEALTAMPAAPVALDLRGCGLGDAGLVALARWPGLARCRVLLLDQNEVAQEGLAALAGSPHARLVGLTLSGNGIRDAGAARLLAADWAGGLEQLSLSHNHLTEGLRPALLAARLPAMKELHVGAAAVSDAVREHLAQVPFVE